MLVWEIVALVCGAISVAVAAYLYKWVMAQPNESEAMAEFSKAVQ
jgi:Na+/H+-translocating membrane pyrophosphatase